MVLGYMLPHVNNIIHLVCKKIPKFVAKNQLYTNKVTLTIHLRFPS